jgi:hypothetical protein
MLYCGQCGAEQHNLEKQSAEMMPCKSCKMELPINGHENERHFFSLFCPGCGKPATFLIQEAGKNASCPICWLPIQLPELKARVKSIAYKGSNGVSEEESNGTPEQAFPEKRNSANTQTFDITCAICQTPLLSSGIATHDCPGCNTFYHDDCWAENKGCAIYGCSEVPETEHHRPIEIPASFWGQEHKSCPKCECEILAAAVRCRHCGTTFSEAAPISRVEFQQRQRRKDRFPKLRRGVIWLSIFCIFPFTAPVALLLGFVWYLTNRKDIKAMPAIYHGLCKIALSVAIGQAAIAVLIFVISYYTTIKI